MREETLRMHALARAGRSDVFRNIDDKNLPFLLKQEDQEGKSVLFSAIQSGNIDFVRFLCNNGADVNAVSNLCRKPTAEAVSYGHFEILKMLIKEFNARIFYRDGYGMSLSHLAIERSCWKSYAYLKQIASLPTVSADKVAAKGVWPIHRLNCDFSLDSRKCLMTICLLGDDLNAKDAEGKSLYNRLKGTMYYEIVHKVVTATQKVMRLENELSNSQDHYFVEAKIFYNELNEFLLKEANIAPSRKNRNAITTRYDHATQQQLLNMTTPPPREKHGNALAPMIASTKEISKKSDVSKWVEDVILHSVRKVSNRADSSEQRNDDYQI